MLRPRRSPAQSGRHAGDEWSTLALLATLVATLAVLYLAKEIFIPFAFALVLSFILAPPATWLQRIHLGRIPSVIIVMTAVMALTGALSWIVAHQLIDVAENLPAYRENIRHKVEAIRSPATGALGRVEKTVADIGKELDGAAPARGRRAATTAENPLPVQVVTPEPSPLVYLQNFARPFLAPVGMFGFVLILTVFILIKREDLRNRFLRLVGVGQLHATTQALDDATERISRYLVLQFLVNGLMGVVLGLGLQLIGVPYAPL
jgi:predicted PurR-regulated permease PerM